jgi:Domain of unknown function (DUF4421)
MRLGRFVFLFCVLSFNVSCLPLNAQDRPQRALADSGYIEKFNDWIVIKTSLVNTSETLIAQGDGFRQVLKPNPSEVLRTYLNYRIISFYLDYVPRFLPGNNDEAIEGKTKVLEFGTNLNFRQWFTELSYSRKQGFYLDNTRDYRSDWKPGDPYFLVPDLYSTTYEADFGYNTNPKLSLSAYSSQTERQLKSAGAFIPRLSFRYDIIDNRTSGDPSTQKSSHFQGLLGAGYQYTLVLSRSVYLSGAFTPLFGYIFADVLTREGDNRSRFSNDGPIYRWDGKLGLGYNGHRIFTGAYLTGTSSTYAQGLTTAVNGNGNLFFEVFFGIRLTAPKFINKAYKTILH